MAAVWITVVLAICAGLAGLAMKKPLIFGKMHKPLKYIMWGIYLAGSVYLMSISITYTALLPVIQMDKLAAGREIVDSIGVPLHLFMLISLVAWGYVTFLAWLAAQVLEEKSTAHEDT